MAAGQVVSDQQTVAWLGRHRKSLGSVAGAVFAAEMWATQALGNGLTLAGIALAGLFGLGVYLIARAGVWWNRRRILLASHSLPAPGPAQTYNAMKREGKRERYVTKQWAAFCQANGITGIGKVIPQLHCVKGNVSGDLTALIMPGKLGVKGAAGMTAVERIRAMAPNIAEVCGCKEVLVQSRGVGNALLSFLWSDQFERVIPISELPVSNIKPGRVPFAVDRQGNPVTIELPQSTLICGMKGGGKSGITHSFMAGLIALDIKTDLYASDPKNGIEMDKYSHEVGPRVPNRALRVAAYASDVEGTIKLIDQFYQAMRERGEQTKNRHWTVKDADQFPLNLLVFDECVAVFSALLKSPANSPARKAYETLKTIESQGRAIGFMVLYLTQLAQKNILEDIRDMVPNQISLKQKNSINTSMVLGENAEALGAPCSRINNTPGLGYMQSEDSRGFVLFRATYCDDDDVARIAKSQLPDGFGSTVGKGEVNRMCAVYRFLSKDSELLYVGITVDLEARWSKHAADKPWWGEVDMSKTLVTWHPSEASARQIEEREIKTRFPRYNKQHNGANPIAVRVPAPSAYSQPRLVQPLPDVALSNVAPIRERRSRPAPAAYTRTRTRKVS